MTFAEPRPAATLCLLADGAEGLEVLMVRRARVASFVGGFHVFPGGRLDEADASDAARAVLPGVVDDLLPFVGAALRETAEETGVLLTAEPRPDLAIEARHLTSDDFYARIEASGTVLRGSDVAYFANWITPESEPKRFDTKFFLVASERAELIVDGTEITDAEWVQPRVALDHAAKGQWAVIFPTWKTLEHLDRFASAADAISHARSIEVEAKQPRVVRAEDGSIKILLPGEPEWSLGADLSI